MSRECPAAELLEAARGGDRKAQDRVIRASMWVVDACVKRIKRPDVADDLRQAALCGVNGEGGLMGAIAAWDAAAGANFWTHATHWIRGAISRELATAQSTEGLATRREMRRRHELKQVQLRRDLGREPEPEELAEAVGENPSVVSCDAQEEFGVGTCNKVTRLDGSNAGRGALAAASMAAALSDGMSSARMTDKLTARRAIELMPETLTEREAYVIEAHALDGRTFQEIGASLGISREWARRSYVLGCARLRAVLEG